MTVGGASDPRAALERAAYSPDATPEEARSALARLQAWDAARADGAAAAGAGAAGSAPSSDAVGAPRSASAVGLGAAEGVGVPDPAVSPPPRARLRRALVAGAGALLVAVGVVAGIQVTQHRADSADASALARAEADSDLGKALARPQQPSDLPLGYQAGSGSAYPGDSYRLLFDGQPRAGSAVLRWRVWIGQGVDGDHLCLVAAYNSARSISTCLPRTQMLTSSVTLTSPVGVQPLMITVEAGRLGVDVG